MMPSMVSPVRQKVPLRCLPFRPYTVDKEACTNALLLLFNCDVGNSAFDKGRKRFSQIKRSNDSIIKFFTLIKNFFFSEFNYSLFYHNQPDDTCNNKELLCSCISLNFFCFNVFYSYYKKYFLTLLCCTATEQKHNKIPLVLFI